MFVPGHVVSMYVATGGASGLSLGSDEKEIILLVFAIIDVVTNKVSVNLIVLLSAQKHWRPFLCFVEILKCFQSTIM